MRVLSSVALERDGEVLCRSWRREEREGRRKVVGVRRRAVRIDCAVGAGVAAAAAGGIARGGGREGGGRDARGGGGCLAGRPGS